MLTPIPGILAATSSTLVLEYLTSTLYPMVIKEEDHLAVNLSTILDAKVYKNLLNEKIGITTPSIVFADMFVTINYIDLTQKDSIQIEAPSILSADLVATVTYVDIATSDLLTITSPSIEAATLQVTINYIDLNARDSLDTSLPTIISATLS